MPHISGYSLSWFSPYPSSGVSHIPVLFLGCPISPSWFWGTIPHSLRVEESQIPHQHATPVMTNECNLGETLGGQKKGSWVPARPGTPFSIQGSAHTSFWIFLSPRPLAGVPSLNKNYLSFLFVWLVWFWGHTRQHSGAPMDSALRNYAWKAWGKPLGCQVLNPGWLHARQMPSLQCSCSDPKSLSL